MEIAHIICTFPPYKGGMGNVAYHEAKELACFGHEVVVFTFIQNNIVETRHRSLSSGQTRLVSTNKEPNFKIIRLKPLLKFGKAAFLPQLLFKLRDFDIVMLHYPFFGSQEIIWLAKKLGLIKKLVIFYHMDFLLNRNFNCSFVFLIKDFCKSLVEIFNRGITRIDTRNNAENNLRKLWLKFLSFPSGLIYKSLLNSADNILVSSFDYARQSQLSNYFQNNKNKFIELPFGADTRICTDVNPVKLSGDNNGAGTGLHRFKDDKIILFVGALDKAHYFKGVDILLKAFKRLIYTLHITHYTLHIVGDGDLRPKYEQQAQELGLTDNIKFLGKISDYNLQKHYTECDVLVLPSTTSGEAFGLVLVEAMAHSKPVIASDLPGVRTVCQNNFNGLLVKPGDANDLAEKIKIILENEGLAHKMGERGRKLVEKKYNWQKHGEKLNKVFTNLI